MQPQSLVPVGESKGQVGLGSLEVFLVCVRACACMVCVCVVSLPWLTRRRLSCVWTPPLGIPDEKCKAY